jgi:conjugal transfer ATP-binding protein TraC
MALNLFNLLNKKSGLKNQAAQSRGGAGQVMPPQAGVPARVQPGQAGQVDPSLQVPQAFAAGVGAPQGSQAHPGQSPGEVLAQGMVSVQDIIAPPAIEVDFNHVRMGNHYFRTLFVSGYPRFVGANWMSPVINFEHSLDISFFYYPVKSKMVLEDLRRKITELEATMMSDQEKGRVVDPVVKAALGDANSLQEQLVKGVEKYFQFSFYITIPAESLEELNDVSARLESTLGSLLLISKTATLQMEEAFQSTLPCGSDKLLITRNMDTTSLATTFPFTSSTLTMDEGIMYGINKHNGSLVIFDRFSMENANTVIFAKSGAGKSYFVKLEALRMLVFGADIMIIDPEEEYRNLCDAVGGNYIDFSANSPSKINPFDLAGVAVEGENELGQKILSLHTLLKLMMGKLSPTEESILDRALIETYRIKGITPDPETQMSQEPPVMEDLYKVLLGGDQPESREMANRLEKFIRGSMTGIFDSQSTIKIDGRMTVFSTKNLEDTLRPIAFYIILDFVWTTIRRDLKKRVLIVEEAWYLMENEDSARFIYGIAKRARKYYLGLTTVSQDVDDFLKSEYGKAIVTNSSIQVLFKQHPAAIEQVADVFYLSEGEKRLLLAADIGEGLFFAGSNHVAINVKASPEEHKLVTTNPEELLKLRREATEAAKATPGVKEARLKDRQVYKQYKPLPPEKTEEPEKKPVVVGMAGDEIKTGPQRPPGIPVPTEKPVSTEGSVSTEKPAPAGKPVEVEVPVEKPVPVGESEPGGGKTPQKAYQKPYQRTAPSGTVPSGDSQSGKPSQKKKEGEIPMDKEIAKEIMSTIEKMNLKKSSSQSGSMPLDRAKS